MVFRLRRSGMTLIATTILHRDVGKRAEVIVTIHHQDGKGVARTVTIHHPDGRKVVIVTIHHLDGKKVVTVTIPLFGEGLPKRTTETLLITEKQPTRPVDTKLDSNRPEICGGRMKK